MYNVYYTVYNVHYTVYNVHYTVYNVHYTVYNVHAWIYIIIFKVKRRLLKEKVFKVIEVFSNYNYFFIQVIKDNYLETAFNVP